MNIPEKLKLHADTAAEEILLTHIHDALESGNWNELVLKLKDGRELSAKFDSDECPECSGRGPGYCPCCKCSR